MSSSEIQPRSIDSEDSTVEQVPTPVSAPVEDSEKPDSEAVEEIERLPTPNLLDVSLASEIDLELAINSVAGPAPTEQEAKLHKRASSVLKLSEENEKLKAELKALTDRLEAAERKKQQVLKSRREQQQQQQQHIMEAPSS